jgi:Fe2+ or Zn2+ uptake regulation protein
MDTGAKSHLTTVLSSCRINQNHFYLLMVNTVSDPSTLKALGFKSTPKRLAILEVMGEARVYLSPEDVWAGLKRRFTRIGFPTVYRNLEDLCQAGLITKIIHPDRRLYYYLCTARHHHHHFVCLSCHRVEDLAFCEAQQIENEVREVLDGTVDLHLLQVYGRCKDCRNRE